MQSYRLRPLRDVDSFSHDFVRSAHYPAVAARDLGRLTTLSKAVVADIDGWGDRLAALDCAATFDRERAALLVFESVFDEALTPDACRVLAAEIQLLLVSGAERRSDPDTRPS